VSCNPRGFFELLSPGALGFEHGEDSRFIVAESSYPALAREARTESAVGVRCEDRRMNITSPADGRRVAEMM
jgi:hypothetical protein